MTAHPQIDLASRWLGGSVIAASDESFGEKENLLTPTPAAFEPGRYGHRGEIVDGWETRRRREPGHDWAIVRLGAPGIVTSVDVDTSFFTGNYPPEASVEACGCEGYPSPAELADPATPWETIVPRSALAGDSHNEFAVPNGRRFTHVRLSTYPDGGIARLRVPGWVVPDPRGLESLTIDLASQEYGGLVVASSDDFYAAASALNRPGRARTMGEGWETRRRREAGHDHVVFRLAFPGRLRRVVIDTAHFKHNATAAVELHGRADETAPPPDAAGWLRLLGRIGLQPDTRHVLEPECTEAVCIVRLDAFPDGGISRVRLIGVIDAAGRRAAGYRWLNALPAGQAAQCLVGAGLDHDVAVEVVRQRPLSEDWPTGLADTAAVARVLSYLVDGSPDPRLSC